MRVQRALPILLLLTACATVKREEFQALKGSHDVLRQRHETLQADTDKLKIDLSTTRERLDNALRANADAKENLLNAGAQASRLEGRIEELAQSDEEGRRQLDIQRANLEVQIQELDKQLKELSVKMNDLASKPPPPPPPTVPVPADKSAHFAALERANDLRDWAAVRILASEYAGRYPTDDKLDGVYFYRGNAEAALGQHPTAIGEYSKVMKSGAKSLYLTRALLALGESYAAVGNCADAKTALGMVEKQRGRSEAVSRDAKAALAKLSVKCK